MSLSNLGVLADARCQLRAIISSMTFEASRGAQRGTDTARLTAVVTDAWLYPKNADDVRLMARLIQEIDAVVSQGIWAYHGKDIMSTITPILDRLPNSTERYHSTSTPAQSGANDSAYGSEEPPRLQQSVSSALPPTRSVSSPIQLEPLGSVAQATDAPVTHPKPGGASKPSTTMSSPSRMSQSSHVTAVSGAADLLVSGKELSAVSRPAPRELVSTPAASLAAVQSGAPLIVVTGDGTLQPDSREVGLVSLAAVQSGSSSFVATGDGTPQPHSREAGIASLAVVQSGDSSLVAMGDGTLQPVSHEAELDAARSPSFESSLVAAAEALPLARSPVKPRRQAGATMPSGQVQGGATSMTGPPQQPNLTDQQQELIEISSGSETEGDDMSTGSSTPEVLPQIGRRDALRSSQPPLRGLGWPSAGGALLNRENTAPNGNLQAGLPRLCSSNSSAALCRTILLLHPPSNCVVTSKNGEPLVGRTESHGDRSGSGDEDTTGGVVNHAPLAVTISSTLANVGGVKPLVDNSGVADTTGECFEAATKAAAAGGAPDDEGRHGSLSEGNIIPRVDEGRSAAAKDTSLTSPGKVSHAPPVVAADNNDALRVDGSAASAAAMLSSVAAGATVGATGGDPDDEGRHGSLTEGNAISRVDKGCSATAGDSEPTDITSTSACTASHAPPVVAADNNEVLRVDGSVASAAATLSSVVAGATAGATGGAPDDEGRHGSPSEENTIPRVGEGRSTTDGVSELKDTSMSAGTAMHAHSVVAADNNDALRVDGQRSLTEETTTRRAVGQRIADIESVADEDVAGDDEQSSRSRSNESIEPRNSPEKLPPQLEASANLRDVDLEVMPPSPTGSQGTEGSGAPDSSPSSSDAEASADQESDDTRSDSDAEACSSGPQEAVVSSRPPASCAVLSAYYDGLPVEVANFLVHVESVAVSRTGPPQEFLRDLAEEENEFFEIQYGEEDEVLQALSLNDIGELRLVQFVQLMHSIILSTCEGAGLNADECLQGCLHASLRRAIDQMHNKRLCASDAAAVAMRVVESVIDAEWDVDLGVYPLPPNPRLRQAKLVKNPRVDITTSSDAYRTAKSNGAEVTGEYASEHLRRATCDGEAPKLSECDLDYLSAAVGASKLAATLCPGAARVTFTPPFNDRYGPNRRGSALLQRGDVYLGTMQIELNFSVHVYSETRSWSGAPLRRWLQRRGSAATADPAIKAFVKDPASYLTRCIAEGCLVDLGHEATAEDERGPCMSAAFTVDCQSEAARVKTWETNANGLNIIYSDTDPTRVVRVASSSAVQRDLDFEDLIYLLSLMSDSPTLRLVHFGGKSRLDRIGGVVQFIEVARVHNSAVYVGIGGPKTDSTAKSNGVYLQDSLLLNVCHDLADARVAGTRVKNYPIGAGAAMAKAEGSADDALPEMKYGNSVIKINPKDIHQAHHPLVAAYESVFADFAATKYGQAADAFLYDATFYHSIRHWKQSALSSSISSKMEKLADTREYSSPKKVKELLDDVSEAVNMLETNMMDGHRVPFHTRLEVKFKITGPLTMASLQNCLTLVNYRNILDTFSLRMSCTEIFATDLILDARNLVSMYIADSFGNHRMTSQGVALSDTKTTEILTVAHTVMNMIGDSNERDQDTSWRHPGGDRAVWKPPHPSDGWCGYRFVGFRRLVERDGPFMDLLVHLRNYCTDIYVEHEHHLHDNAAAGHPDRSIVSFCRNISELWLRMVAVLRDLISNASIRPANKPENPTRTWICSSAVDPETRLGGGAKIGYGSASVAEMIASLLSTVFRHPPRTKRPKKLAHGFDLPALARNLFATPESWKRYIGVQQRQPTPEADEARQLALFHFDAALSIVTRIQEIDHAPEWEEHLGQNGHHNMEGDLEMFFTPRGLDTFRQSSRQRPEDRMGRRNYLHQQLMRSRYVFGRPLISRRQKAAQVTQSHESDSSADENAEEIAEESAEESAVDALLAHVSGDGQARRGEPSRRRRREPRLLRRREARPLRRGRPSTDQDTPEHSAASPSGSCPDIEVDQTNLASSINECFGSGDVTDHGREEAREILRGLHGIVSAVSPEADLSLAALRKPLSSINKPKTGGGTTLEDVIFSLKSFAAGRHVRLTPAMRLESFIAPFQRSAKKSSTWLWRSKLPCAFYGYDVSNIRDKDFILSVVECPDGKDSRAYAVVLVHLGPGEDDSRGCSQIEVVAFGKDPDLDVLLCHLAVIYGQRSAHWQGGLSHPLEIKVCHEGISTRVASSPQARYAHAECRAISLTLHYLMKGRRTGGLRTSLSASLQGATLQPEAVSEFVQKLQDSYRGRRSKRAADDAARQLLPHFEKLGCTHDYQAVKKTIKFAVGDFSLPIFYSNILLHLQKTSHVGQKVQLAAEVGRLLDETVKQRLFRCSLTASPVHVDLISTPPRRQAPSDINTTGTPPGPPAAMRLQPRSTAEKAAGEDDDNAREDPSVREAEQPSIPVPAGGRLRTSPHVDVGWYPEGDGSSSSASSEGADEESPPGKRAHISIKGPHSTVDVEEASIGQELSPNLSPQSSLLVSRGTQGCNVAGDNVVVDVTRACGPSNKDSPQPTAANVSPNAKPYNNQASEAGEDIVVDAALPFSSSSVELPPAKRARNISQAGPASMSETEEADIEQESLPSSPKKLPLGPSDSSEQCYDGGGGAMADVESASEPSIEDIASTKNKHVTDSAPQNNRAGTTDPHRAKRSGASESSAAGSPCKKPPRRSTTNLTTPNTVPDTTRGKVPSSCKATPGCRSEKRRGNVASPREDTSSSKKRTSIPNGNAAVSLPKALQEDQSERRRGRRPQNGPAGPSTRTARHQSELDVRESERRSQSGTTLPQSELDARDSEFLAMEAMKITTLHSVMDKHLDFNEALTVRPVGVRNTSTDMCYFTCALHVLRVYAFDMADTTDDRNELIQARHTGLCTLLSHPRLADNLNPGSEDHVLLAQDPSLVGLIACSALVSTLVQLCGLTSRDALNVTSLRTVLYIAAQRLNCTDVIIAPFAPEVKHRSTEVSKISLATE